MRQWLLSFTIFLALPAFAGQAVAAQIKSLDNTLDNAQIDMRIVDLDIGSVMTLVGKQFGFNVILDKAIKGRLKNTVLSGSLRSSLDRIADRTNSVWWHKGEEIHFTGRGNMTTRTLKVRNTNLLVEAARSFGFPTNALKFERISGAGMTRVSGPRPLVNDIKKLSDDLRKNLNRIKVTRYGMRSSSRTKDF